MGVVAKYARLGMQNRLEYSVVAYCCQLLWLVGSGRMVDAVIIAVSVLFFTFYRKLY